MGGASRPSLAGVIFVTGSSVTAITVMVALKDTLRDPCRPSGVGRRAEMQSCERLQSVFREVLSTAQSRDAEKPSSQMRSAADMFYF